MGVRDGRVSGRCHEFGGEIQAGSRVTCVLPRAEVGVGSLVSGELGLCPANVCVGPCVLLGLVAMGGVLPVMDSFSSCLAMCSGTCLSCFVLAAGLPDAQIWL